MDHAANQKNHAKLLAKAWTDPAFRARLLADPNATVAQMGLKVPPGKKLHIVENTDTDVYLVLPKPPPGTELSDEALDQAVGGACSCSANSNEWI
jgi:hypothetical protein